MAGGSQWTGDNANNGNQMPLPLFRIVLISIALIGIQFAWSVELITVSPYFDGLGLSPFLSHFVWAIGPVSGFVVGPTVGIFSDNCQSKFGRRRPFVLVGVILLGVSMAVFSNSRDIGVWFGDPKREDSPHSLASPVSSALLSDENEKKPTIAIVIALISFLCMDLSINTVQGPLRALISDLVSNDQQNLGQAMATLMQAFGAVLGNLTCYLAIDPDKSLINTMRWIYLAGYGLMILTVSVTLVVGRETPFRRPPNAPRFAWYTPFQSVANGVTKMQKEMKRVCFVQFWAWMAWFTFLPTVSSYMGIVVYGGCSQQGCPKYKDYQKGLAFTSLGNIFQASIQFGFSFIIPPLVGLFGMRIIYFYSYIILATAFFLMALIPNNILAISMIGITGISFATTNTFPFALVGQYYKEASQQGLNMGILNWFIVIPQLLDTTWTGAAAGSRKDAAFLQSDAFVLFFGAFFALIAALSTYGLILEPKLEEVSVENPQQEEEKSPLVQQQTFIN